MGLGIYTPVLPYLVMLSIVGWTSATLPKPEYRYYSHSERTEFLKNAAQAYPNITHLYSIGQSVSGRELWVLIIGENPRGHVSLRPDVKYVGNMHGNEIANQVLLLHLIHHMLTEYTSNSTLSDFLRTTRVHIMPSMNPDGAEKAINDPLIGSRFTWNGQLNSSRLDQVCHGVYGRYNKRGYDLNRNFPDWFIGNAGNPRQPETVAVMNWLKAYQFVLSANLHGGALLANYPLDSYPNANENKYSASQDDDVFIVLSKAYSYSHRNMFRGDGCSKRGEVVYEFPDGITNGAQWYPIHGGMQDYNYFFAGCLELTLELHCCKFTPVTLLEERWEENKDAFINYLMMAHMGVKGIVRTDFGLELKGATVRIAGRENFLSRTTPFGEFWRLLLPGTYILEIYKSGYEIWTEEITVFGGPALVLNITLKEDETTKIVRQVVSSNAARFYQVFLRDLALPFMLSVLYLSRN